MALITKKDLPFLAYVVAILSLRLVPQDLRLRLNEQSSKLLGTIWYELARSDAALAREHLQRVLGLHTSNEVDETTRKIFQILVLGKLLGDNGDLSLEAVTKLLRFDGNEHIDRALALGRGAILLRTHTTLHGYIELELLTRMGYDVVAVFGEEIEPDDSWAYHRLIYPVRRQGRSRYTVLDPDGTPQPEMMRSLQQNKLLVITGDTLEEGMRLGQPPQVLFSRLLGHALPVMTGPFRLARWFNAPLLPCFVIPEAKAFRFVVQEPIRLSSDSSLSGIADDIRAYMARFEPYLRRYPEMWAHWRHKSLSSLMQPTTEDQAPVAQLIASAI